MFKSYKIIIICCLTIIAISCALDDSFARNRAEEVFEILIDADNNGVIDNSELERQLDDNPCAFGKIIPYDKAEPKFVEMRVVIPAVQKANVHRTLSFTFESNELSLWKKTPKGDMVCIFKPNASNVPKEEKVPTVNDNNVQAEDEQKPQSVWNTITDAVSGSVGKAMDYISDIWNRNIDEVPQEPTEEIILTFNKETFAYPDQIPNKPTVLIFYLKSEVAPSHQDWMESKKYERPTRRIQATLKEGDITASASATFIVAGRTSIYAAIVKQPILSECIAARAVYYGAQSDVNKYGLELLTNNFLKEKWGFTQDELKDFEETTFSGYRVLFYRDWIHDKYYIAFKGTDLKLSLLSDVCNNIQIGAGQPAPYVWQSLRLGCILNEKFPAKDKEKCVLVGHSLGGALASATAIVSGIRADTFNALGLPYIELKSVIEDLQKRSPVCNCCKEKAESCFLPPQNPKIPNLREFDKSSAPIYTFHTQDDALTLFAENINTEIKAKDGTPVDIVPTAIGEKLVIDPNDAVTAQGNTKELREVVQLLNIIINELVKDGKSLTLENIRSYLKDISSVLSSFSDNDKSRNSGWFETIRSVGNIASKFHKYLKYFNGKTKDEFDLAVKRHSTEAVIEEVLQQSCMPEAYGKETP